MIRDIRAIPEREFNLPLDWISDELLLQMQRELLTEIQILHPQVRHDGEKRNGLWHVNREIGWRELAPAPCSEDTSGTEQGAAQSATGASAGGMAGANQDSCADSVAP